MRRKTDFFTAEEKST
jgi:hypothetical protein